MWIVVFTFYLFTFLNTFSNRFSIPFSISFKYYFFIISFTFLYSFFNIFFILSLFIPNNYIFQIPNSYIFKSPNNNIFKATHTQSEWKPLYMGSTHTHTKSEWEPLYIGSTHTHKIWMKALYIGSMKFEQKNKSFNTICWCKHNDNANNTKRNWIILLNFIHLNREITQYYLDWGTTLALFKEIQALGWLNFVTDADLLWLVSPRIQQPNKCCMAKTTSTQTQNSIKKNTFPCQEPLYFFFLVYIAVTWIESEWIYL